MMTGKRRTSELRSDVRLAVVRSALSGEVLSGWWAPDWSGARSHAVSSGGGWHDSECHGERRAEGIFVWLGERYDGPPPDLNEHHFEDRVRPPDVIIKWSEIHDIVRRGATPDRREAYQSAYARYVEQATTPLPHPNRRNPPEGWDYRSDPENVAHWEASSRTIGELQSAGRAIIEAGCAQELVQDTLFDIPEPDIDTSDHGIDL